MRSLKNKFGYKALKLSTSIENLYKKKENEKDPEKRKEINEKIKKL